MGERTLPFSVVAANIFGSGEVSDADSMVRVVFHASGYRTCMVSAAQSVSLQSSTYGLLECLQVLMGL